MGVRGALRRWLLSDDDGAGLPDRDQPPSWPRGSTVTEVNPAPPALPVAIPATVPAYPPPANGAPPHVNVPPAAAPVAAPPAPHRVEPRAGELVVGNAERRYPPPDLPDFYVPKAPPPAAFPVGVADYDPAKLAEAWALVSDRADRLVGDFYAELFMRLREAPMMFPSNMTRQRQEFGRAVVQWVVADDPDTLAGHLEQLGADHRKFDVEPRHYEVAGVAMVSAWKRLAGPRWTAEHEAAIVGSYTKLASIMIDGAMRHAHEPASWGAQVVGHQRIGADFAVLRLQADAPYPYKAGQYLTLELPAHRRQWRHMSIASAPRSDNTFDIHVRAIGSSGVSAALVGHTRVGDRLLLGPPRGNDLVIEPGTVPGGLLCVAAGTGAAPISAVVESILGWPTVPRLHTFVGARTREDTYSVDRMFRLIQTGGYWLDAEVHAVLSDDPGYPGYRGRVEDVVPNLRDWAMLGVDVLIAGPDPMIATTVRKLSDGGVPMSKIHFDQFEMAS